MSQEEGKEPKLQELGIDISEVDGWDLKDQEENGDDE